MRFHLFFSANIDFSCSLINEIEGDFYVSVAKSSRKVDENFSQLKRNGISLHNILVSESTDLKLVTLPLLLFNDYPDGMEWNKQKNSVIYFVTPFVKYVYSILEEHKRIPSIVGLHILGTIGMGKTAAMYTCCYALRSRQEEKIYVTYVSCCKVWKEEENRAYNYFLTELVQTFYMLDNIKPPVDRPDVKSVVDWAAYVQEIINGSRSNFALHYRTLIDMVESISKAVRNMNLFWVVVFDNHNALDHNDAYKAKPFVIINYFSSFFCHNPNCGILVISSNNNEHYNLNSDYFKEVDLGGVQSNFQEDHVRNLLIATNQINHIQYPLTDAVKIVMQCTEGIPIEVYEFWKISNFVIKHFGIDPVADMNEFLQIRCDKLRRKIGNFYRFQCINKNSFQTVVARVILGLPCTEDSYDNFDRRFVSRELYEGGPMYLLKPVSELVTRIFKGILLDLEDSVYEHYIRSIAKNKYILPAACYIHIENYIIRQIGSRDECKLSLKWLDKDGTHDNASYISYNEKLIIKNFKGMATPEFAFKREATLYYPDNNQYPAVNFLLFLPEGSERTEDVLWAIKVSGALKPEDHILKDIKMFKPKQLVCGKLVDNIVVPALHDKWAKYCKIPPKNVMIVWFLKYDPPQCNKEIQLHLRWDDPGLCDICPLITLFK